MKRDAAHVLDEYLAASARAGDRSAFDQLVARWQPKLLVHAYRLAGDKELARDVVQESWSDIVRGLYRLDDPATLRTADALPTHCRRTADAIRRLQRFRKVKASFAMEPKNSTISAKAIEYHADAHPLRRAIAELPAEHRAAIALHYLEGLTVTEIAMALSIPAGTVKTRLMNARRKMRVILEGEK